MTVDQKDEYKSLWKLWYDQMWQMFGQIYSIGMSDLHVVLYNKIE